MEDFNNADISVLPDLTGDAPTGAVAEGTNQASPESQSTEGQETVTNEGQEPTSEANKGQADGEPSTEGEGTQANVNQQAPEGDESEAPQNQKEPSSADFLSEMSEGRINSSEDFGGLLSHYDELKEAVENPELLLPEGKARDAFKYAMQFNGSPSEANKSFHHIMSIDTDSKPPKELQFEAYMLKEENADLISDPKARDYFEAEYENNFEGLEDGDDQIMQRRHQVATNEAKRIINEKQAQFQSEKPVDDNEQGLSPEELRAYNDSMDNTLAGYDGINLNFADDDGEGMNVVLDNQEKQRFQNYVRNPNLWLEDTISKFIDDKGTLNTEGFADHMMMAMNSEKVASLAYAQGVADTNIKREDGLRNTSGEQTGGATPMKQEGTMYDAFEEALESQG